MLAGNIQALTINQLEDVYESKNCIFCISINMRLLFSFGNVMV